MLLSREEIASLLRKYDLPIKTTTVRGCDVPVSYIDAELPSLWWLSAFDVTGVGGGDQLTLAQLHAVQRVANLLATRSCPDLNVIQRMWHDLGAGWRGEIVDGAVVTDFTHLTLKREPVCKEFTDQLLTGHMTPADVAFFQQLASLGVEGGRDEGHAAAQQWVCERLGIPFPFSTVDPSQQVQEIGLAEMNAVIQELHQPVRTAFAAVGDDVLGFVQALESRLQNWRNQTYPAKRAVGDPEPGHKDFPAYPGQPAMIQAYYRTPQPLTFDELRWVNMVENLFKHNNPWKILDIAQTPTDRNWQVGMDSFHGRSASLLILTMQHMPRDADLAYECFIRGLERIEQGDIDEYDIEAGINSIGNHAPLLIGDTNFISRKLQTTALGALRGCHEPTSLFSTVLELISTDTEAVIEKIKGYFRPEYRVTVQLRTDAFR